MSLKERNVRSMTEEIDGSWDRASEQAQIEQGDVRADDEPHGVHVATEHLQHYSPHSQRNESSLNYRAQRRAAHHLFPTNSGVASHSNQTGRRTDSCWIRVESQCSPRQQLQILSWDAYLISILLAERSKPAWKRFQKKTAFTPRKLPAEAVASLQNAEIALRNTELACKSLVESSSLEGDSDSTRKKTSPAPEYSNLNSATFRAHRFDRILLFSPGSALRTECKPNFPTDEWKTPRQCAMRRKTVLRS